jgi:putative addiction module killer protein
MFEVRRTAEFVDWIVGLRDVAARARIAKRIDRIALGNFGDAKAVGDGVSELRFTFGPGYRVYYTRRGDVVVILLCGGDKDTQGKDIERAKAMVRELGTQES